MRNKYSGMCYYCKKVVDVGKGHFERHKGKWKVIHSECVFEQRREKENNKILNEIRKIEEEI